MAMGHAGPQSLAPWRPTTHTGHFGAGSGLLNEHQLGRVKIGLGLEPGFTRGGDVLPVLLGRVRRFFQV